MNIKILGGGCTSCKKLYENTKKAVAETGIKAEVEYITDMEKVMAYSVMSMPALVVNEQVVAMGKVLKPAEIVKILEKVSG
ncbi:MAG: thioredoxin family protein [Ruminococcus sp.]|nr:thioredoxin family protein [Ruminococcus sp.]